MKPADCKAKSKGTFDQDYRVLTEAATQPESGVVLRLPPQSMFTWGDLFMGWTGLFDEVDKLGNVVQHQPGHNTVPGRAQNVIRSEPLGIKAKT